MSCSILQSLKQIQYFGCLNLFLLLNLESVRLNCYIFRVDVKSRAVFIR